MRGTPLSSITPDAKRGLTRRQLLRFGGVGALSWLWADWLSAAAAGASLSTAKAKSVILIFNAGAPSHLDLWDMKPGAPENVRGPFKPIATSVPAERGQDNRCESCRF